MAHIFITGSADGLGRAAARTLLTAGHQIVLHARTQDRVSVVDDLVSAGADVVVGDLRSAAETTSVADQVNAIGRMLGDDLVLRTRLVQGSTKALGVRLDDRI